MPGGKYGSSRKGNTGRFSMQFSGFKKAPTNYGMEETPMLFKLKNPFSKKNRISRVSKKLTTAENATNANPSKKNQRKEHRLTTRYNNLTEGKNR